LANNEPRVSIIPLGGIGEIGKNMTIVKFGDDIIVIDAGQMFPDEELLGVDSVIPDTSFLEDNADKVRAIVLTHGHEDHIGALPYILKEINIPIYGTRLTLGLVKAKLEEHNLLEKVELREIKAGGNSTIGPFFLEYLKVNHSIPDAIGIAIHTPVGIILHTGDFKIDQTPVDGVVMDLNKFAELGKKGVLLLISDSTNVERPGFTMSEKTVGRTIEDIFSYAEDRILVATFASNVHRIQQIIDAADKYNRKIAVIGKSMVNVVNIASELGYLSIPKELIVEIDEINKLPKNRIVIITTGSQGEPMAALSKIAVSNHRKVDIIPGDTVLIAASPIPGNEKLVARTINNLFKRGAKVIYESLSGVHVSGHASQEELKLILNLTKPKFFMPAHGEYRHLVKHVNLAEEVGIKRGNIFIVENGNILEISRNRGAIVGKVPAGKVLVDGLGVGDVGNVVLRDRKHLSQDGIIIVVITMDKQSGEIIAGPDIISRGFVYVRESEELLEEAREKVESALEKYERNRPQEWSIIKSIVRDALVNYLYEKTRRRPMILPVIMEV
jgi:ribonuclease J